ncbi:ATP-binding protein [Elusimicrobiota bacterium]
MQKNRSLKNQQGFSDVLGQEKAVSTLKIIWAKKLNPSFMIFAGPKGIGKMKTAKIYGSSLLCDKPSLKEGPCYECKSCSDADKNIHPDLHVIDFEYQSLVSTKSTTQSALKIETMRGMLGELHRKPYYGKAIIAIIDDADKLTVAAQNALLKELEEAPKDVFWIFCATSIEGILPTIRSRANWTIYFKPINTEILSQILIKECDLDEKKASSIAPLCLGSLERAKTLINASKGAKSGQGQITAPKKLSPKEVLLLSQKIARFRSHARARDAVREFLDDYLTLTLALWRKDPVPSNLKALNNIIKAQKDLDTNLTPAIVLENLLLK